MSAEIKLRTAAPPFGEAVVLTPDYDDASWRLVAGGIDPAMVGWWDWLVYLTRSGVIVAIPLAALTALPAIALATWFAMRGLAPVTRYAAAIDADHLQRRLDPARVPKELMPLAGAINAALDRLASELDRKQRFIADAFHELTTPVAIMGMRVAALPPSNERRDLERGQARLSALIGQVLDVERTTMRIADLGAVDLVRIAREAVADHALIAIKAGCAIALTGEVAATVMVMGKPHIMVRALANIIGNAVAHGGGGGLIDVHVDADGSIVVSDQGPGIPHDARERVFEAFHRERWDRYGCGLGLHFVREVMRALGGRASILDGAGCRVALHFRVLAAPTASLRQV